MSAASPLEARLQGTRAGAVREEFLANSAYFPLANIFFEPLREDWGRFLASPDPWVLVAAACIQAWFLGSRRHAGRPLPFLGNLVGPAVYTAIEAVIDGACFFLSLTTRPTGASPWRSGRRRSWAFAPAAPVRASPPRSRRTCFGRESSW